MQLTIIPNSDRSSLVRFSLLVALLILISGFVWKLRKFDPGAAFLSFSEQALMKSATNIVSGLPGVVGPRPMPDKRYNQSLFEQSALSADCDRFFGRNRRTPISISELVQQSSRSRDDETDPWGKPYLLRSTRSTPCVIQSTGPSGKDQFQEVIQQWQTGFKKEDGTAFFIGDNLIVVGQAVGAR